MFLHSLTFAVVMRRSFTFHYIGYFLIAVSVALGIYHLAAWLATGNIGYVFNYPGVVSMVSLPVGVVTMVLFIYLMLAHLRRRNDARFMYAWILHLVFVSALFVFFKIESGKVSIVVRNTSTRRIGPVHVTARNNQFFHAGMVLAGDSVQFKCMCREVVEGDTIGIRASIATRASKPPTEQKKSSKDRVFFLAHPQVRPASSRLVLTVASDTVARVSEEY